MYTCSLFVSIVNMVQLINDFLLIATTKVRRCYKIANRNDVAKMAGVSGATVSRVFNAPETVNKATKEAVLSAAEELGYHPNAIASNFVKGRSGNIGIIIPQIPNVHIFSVYYFSEILSGIGAALEDKGYDLLLFFHNIDEKEADNYLRFFNRGKVDGCILLGTKRNDCGLLTLRDAGFNFCLINNYIVDSAISFIDVDNITGSRQAVKHLISLGHRNIAFLNGPDCFTNSIDRLEGYKYELMENGIEFIGENVLHGNYGRKSGFEAAEELLKLKKRPTAVFCANDRMAAGLVQAFKEKGVNIPEDIAIVGYDDSDIARLVEPAMTSVRVPFYELGRRCAVEFCNQLNSEVKDKFGIFMKPELVIRESSTGKKV